MTEKAKEEVCSIKQEVGCIVERNRQKFGPLCNLVMIHTSNMAKKTKQDLVPPYRNFGRILETVHRRVNRTKISAVWAT